MIRGIDPLDAFAQILRHGGFEVEGIDLPTLGESLLAETPHALVLCTQSAWDSLPAIGDEAQAQLTQLAAGAPSARSWDLYVVIAIGQSATEADEVARERIEHDTRYARKLVVAGPAITDPEALRRALRPLLPLQPAASVHLADPLAAVREALMSAGLDGAMVELAFASFQSKGEVDVE